MTIIEALEKGKTAAAIAMLGKRSERERLTEPNRSNVVTVGAYHGNVEFVAAAIGAGVSASHVRNDGYTALVIAAERGHAKLIPILVAAGAELEHELKNGNTALAQVLVLAHFDADDRKLRASRLAAARALLAAGANPDVENQWKNNLLADAFAQGDHDAARLLLAAGAMLTGKRSDGETLIELALRDSDPEMLIALVERGIDPKPIVDWVKRHRHAGVVAALEARGARVAPPRRGALRLEALDSPGAVALLEERKVFGKVKRWWPKRMRGGLLHRGDLRLAKLHLDEGELVSGRQSPQLDQLLIVDGDLVIDGTLWNGEQDFGPCLIVLGDLVAKTIAVGGANIFVRGNIRADTFHGYYNHGTLAVTGAGTFGLFIADDYSATFAGKVVGSAITRTGSVKSSSRPVEADMRKVLAAPFWKLDEGEPVLKGHAIYSALIKGRSIRA